MEKRYKCIEEFLSQDLLYQKTYPLRDPTFDAGCLSPLRILKIVTVCSKYGFW